MQDKEKQAESGKETKKSGKKKRLSAFKKFLIIYAAVFVVIAAIILILLHGILKDYEASEPNNVMEEYVKDFNLEKLYELVESSSVEKTEFETEDVLKEYFAAKMEGGKVTYRRKSGEFTASKPVYTLMAGDEPIAKVTLAEKGKNGHGFMEWKLGEVELEAISEESKKEITITVPANAKVYINGVAMAETYKTGDDKPVDITKNLGDFGEAAYERTYKVAGLIKTPEVSAVLGDKQLELSQSEDGSAYSADYPTDDALLNEQKDYITTIFEDYGKYLINRGNLERLLSYTQGKAYENLSNIPAVWAYLYGQQYTYEFRNKSVTNLVHYSENCYTVDVYFDLYVDYYQGNITYNTSMTYVMVKKDNVWYLTDFVQHQIESEDN